MPPPHLHFQPDGQVLLAAVAVAHHHWAACEHQAGQAGPGRAGFFLRGAAGWVQRSGGWFSSKLPSNNAQCMQLAPASAPLTFVNAQLHQASLLLAAMPIAASQAGFHNGLAHGLREEAQNAVGLWIVKRCHCVFLCMLASRLLRCPCAVLLCRLVQQRAQAAARRLRRRGKRCLVCRWARPGAWEELRQEGAQPKCLAAWPAAAAADAAHRVASRILISTKASLA